MYFFFIIFAFELHARIIILICDYIFFYYFAQYLNDETQFFIEVGKMVIKELKPFIDDLNCFSDLMELYDFAFE